MRAVCLALLAVLLLQPAGAQAVQWNAIACTSEIPAYLRGLVMTIYFSDDGKIAYNGKQYTGTVTYAGIQFCYTTEKNERGCFRISRLSGRFSLASPLVRMGGSCVAADKPKS